MTYIYIYVVRLQKVNNQPDALFKFIYFISVHVSSNPVLIIRRINCSNTSSGMYHCVGDWYAGPEVPAYQTVTYTE